MKLAELQRTFQAHVLNGSAEIAAIVPGSEHFDTATRLGIYSGGYADRLVEALAHTYPAVRYALGLPAFARLVSLLAHSSPSTHFSVRFYGRELAELIERELSGPRASGAAELARFEWALAGAFDAADRAPLTAVDLEGMDAAEWPHLKFTPAPSLHRVVLRTNAVRWWRAACEGAPCPPRWRSRAPCEWLLWRRELAIYFRPLPEDEARALAALESGTTFAEICERLTELRGARRAPLRAAQLLRAWLADGLIVAVAR
jgi:hypothetical protein